MVAKAMSGDGILKVSGSADGYQEKLKREESDNHTLLL